MTRAEIQALLDALGPGGGQVVIPAGTHTLDGKLYINTDKVDFVGEPGAVLLMQANTLEANYGLLSIDGCSYIKVHGFVLDGNKANQGAYAATPEVVNGNLATHVLIYDCEVKNSKGDGIQPVDCDHFWLWNIYAHDNDEHATHFNGVTNGWMMNCRLEDDGNSLHAEGHGGCNGVIIENNVFAHAKAGSFAVQVSGNDAPAGMREKIQVINNTFIGNGDRGVVVCEDATDILVSGNAFYNPNVPTIQVGTNPVSVTIENNAGIPPGTVVWL